MPDNKRKMELNDKRTQSVRTRWIIEIFPYEDLYPAPETKVFGPVNKTNGFPKFTLASEKDAKTVQEEIDGQSDTIVAGGLISLRLRRSKGTPDGQCTFTIAGRVPSAIIPGTWVIVTSVNNSSDGAETKLMRFIGQIYNIDVDYSVQESGNLTTRTTVNVREWSSVLSMPVRYDVFSIVNSLNPDTAAPPILQFAKPELSADELQKIATSAWNPYELAHIILKLIGAISKKDELNSIEALGKLKLPEVAVTMPSVPQELLVRLGLEGVDAKNPFLDGFVSVVTGHQKEGVYNDGSWDGLFAFAPKPTTNPVLNRLAQSVATTQANTGVPFPNIDQFKKSFDRNPANRPVSLGLAALLSTGAGAWPLITQYCDPSLNEFFTDMWYQPERGGTEGERGSIIARPVIVIRDKPFLMRKLKDDNKTTKLDSWTVYDNLPRVRIDNVYIQSFRAKNTFINSPNFIRTNFQPQGIDADAIKTLSQIFGTVRLTPEMRRFGGNELFVETNFLSQDVIKGTDKNVNFSDWFEQIKTVAASWHSTNYRMGSGSLSIKDDNIPISVGFNVQFTFGNYELVGHVDDIDISFTVRGDGAHVTSTNVTLSRIVQDLGGKLDFIPPDAWANLLDSEPVPSPGFGLPISTPASQATEALQTVKDAVNRLL